MDLAAPTTFQVNTIYVNIGGVSGKWTDTPGFNMLISLFIQVADGLGDTFVPQKASVISSTRRIETPARYILIGASSTEDSLRRDLFDDGCLDVYGKPYTSRKDPLLV